MTNSTLKANIQYSISMYYAYDVHSVLLCFFYILILLLLLILFCIFIWLGHRWWMDNDFICYDVTFIYIYVCVWLIQSGFHIIITTTTTWIPYQNRLKIFILWHIYHSSLFVFWDLFEMWKWTAIFGQQLNTRRRPRPLSHQPFVCISLLNLF